MFLEILQNAQENNYARVSFLLKLQAHNFTEKETLARVFSYEFCEISKNTFSYRTPPMDASAGTILFSLRLRLVLRARNIYMENVL